MAVLCTEELVMPQPLLVLMLEAVAIYFLVLAAHAVRKRFGLAPFYALIGGLTAIMSWVTDASVTVDAFGLSFMVGSTVFYTSLLLAVFVVYVFDGIHATRVAIFTVAGVSVMVPVIAAVLHLQMMLAGHDTLGYVPTPSLRINAASVFTTITDLLFLAMAWEFLGKSALRVPLWLRAYLTLLGVMWLDVLLFNTGAFLGEPNYLAIMGGTLLSRLVISLFAFPFLYSYLQWQSRRHGVVIENRPILAIIREVTDVRKELSSAQEEIRRRKAAEAENIRLIGELQRALAEVKTLRGFLPICASCKNVRDDAGYWQKIEQYVESRSDARFTHGICPSCIERLYPDLGPERAGE